MILLRSVLFGLACCAQAIQAQEARPIQVPPAPPDSGVSQRQTCPVTAGIAIATKSTIEARLSMSLDARRQKPGKKLWVNSVHGMDLDVCRMQPGAPVYGVVSAASSSQKQGTSELSLAFDAVDCVGGVKRPLDLMIVAVYAPPDKDVRDHDVLPVQSQGIDAAAATIGHDAKLDSPGPRGVTLGTVMGYKHLRLEPQGGPHCSSRLVSTAKDLVLAAGTVLLLAPRKVE